MIFLRSFGSNRDITIFIERNHVILSYRKRVSLINHDFNLHWKQIFVEIFEIFKGRIKTIKTDTVIYVCETSGFQI